MRGRTKAWKVFVPDPSGISTTHMIYDSQGNPKGAIQSAAPTGKMIELHSVFNTAEEAVAYAREIGYAEVTVTRLKTKVESLAKAREARRKKGEA